MYRFRLVSNSALDRSEWSLSRTPGCPLNSRLREPQGRSGRFGEEKKKSVAPFGIRIPDHTTSSLAYARLCYATLLKVH